MVQWRKTGKTVLKRWIALRNVFEPTLRDMRSTHMVVRQQAVNHMFVSITGGRMDV